MGAPNQGFKKPYVFERPKENVLRCNFFKNLNVHSLAFFVIVATRMQLIFESCINCPTFQIYTIYN